MQPRVTYPELAEPYAFALRSCVEWVLGNYEVVAIIACGTIIRGTPDRASDLDIHVLHRKPFRERIQRFFGGVPCEVFVNPTHRLTRYFRDEAADRRPMTAHMFATGFVVVDEGNVMPDLISQARSLLSSPPAIESRPVPRGAYGAATLFEDAEDLVERDPDAALLLLQGAVRELIACRFEAGPGWLPRPKDELSRLRELDPVAADLVLSSLRGPLEAKLQAGRALCQHVTGATGFFEWSSPREVVDFEPA